VVWSFGRGRSRGSSASWTVVGLFGFCLGMDRGSGPVVKVSELGWSGPVVKFNPELEAVGCFPELKAVGLGRGRSRGGSGPVVKFGPELEAVGCFPELKAVGLGRGRSRGGSGPVVKFGVELDKAVGCFALFLGRGWG
jgi:hypothetical protein